VQVARGGKQKSKKGKKGKKGQKVLLPFLFFLPFLLPSVAFIRRPLAQVEFYFAQAKSNLPKSA
jgi:hypothetical protein